MQAYVYKSLRKADTYVFLSVRDDFARLPDSLRQQLDPLQFVLDVELTAQRKLARADAATVRENLGARGFHIQFPPLPGAVTGADTAAGIAAQIGPSTEAAQPDA